MALQAPGQALPLRYRPRNSADPREHERTQLFRLMIGNFVIGTSVLARTGMLNELASDVAGSTHAAGLLVTWGAVVLCVGSPVMSGVTSRVDRRGP
jgi:predicted MFS family arabinose efflux permease